MSIMHKYEFDLLDLAPPLSAFDIITLAPEEAAPPPPPVFSHEELTEAEERSFRAGQTQGEAAALSRIEMRLADTMEQISYALRDAATAQHEALADLEHSAASLMLACLKKLFPIFLAECGTTESEALIARAFSQAVSEPRLIVRCPIEDEAALTAHLHNTAKNVGFEGKLCVISDAKLSPGDCRVGWAHGGMNRDSSAVTSAIETAIRQNIRQPVSFSDNTNSEQADPGALQGPSGEFSA